MHFKLKLFLFLLSLTVCCNAFKCTSKTPSPEWPSLYTVKGSIIIPYAELVEPFHAWYDEAGKQSRIDYYNGMVKTYQLGKRLDYGTSLKIAPITTEDVLNAVTCLQVNGTGENQILPQKILPELTGFECIGNEMINGVQTQKWRLKTEFGDKINKYTMWVQTKPNPNSKSKNAAIPVRYEMKGYNSLLGSHYDHYYLDYDSFDTTNINDDIFKLETDMTCQSFPGPGDKHIYTFNPMREFMFPHYDSHLDFEFDKFKVKHGKNYNDPIEHTTRKEVFRQNIRFIHSTNRAQKGYTLSVNHLADRTDLELKALRGKQYTKANNGGQPFPFQPEHVEFLSKSLPDQMDWRLYGAVTPVKDQSVCGSCWSFGTVGAIEGALFLKEGKLTRLSQQALIDCSWGFGNNGCDGGEDFRSYAWMIKHGGIPTEEEYGPYLGQDGYCHIQNVSMVAKITGFINVTTNDINALRLAIAKHGPISVAIDASHKTFSFYSNGVYYDDQCGNRIDQLDHAVLAVGYGTINGEPYWLIKNSWSTYWGNDGYVLMSARNNNCGVMTTPTYAMM